MPTIEERLEAITHNLELVSQMQLKTEQVVNLLAEDQAKTERAIARTERVMARLAIIVTDHEDRLSGLEEGS
jgi:hypothetical protein